MKTAAYSILMFIYICAIIMAYVKNGQPKESKTYEFKKTAIVFLFIVALTSLIYWL